MADGLQKVTFHHLKHCGISGFRILNLKRHMKSSTSSKNQNLLNSWSEVEQRRSNSFEYKIFPIFMFITYISTLPLSIGNAARTEYNNICPKLACKPAKYLFLIFKFKVFYHFGTRISIFKPCIFV